MAQQALMADDELMKAGAVQLMVQRAWKEHDELIKAVAVPYVKMVQESWNEHVDNELMKAAGAVLVRQKMVQQAWGELVGNELMKADQLSYELTRKSKRSSGIVLV